MMDWQGKPVLVTGASGFIGSHLVEALVGRGAQVRAMAHYNSRNDAGLLHYVSEAARAGTDIFYGDLKDPWSVRQAMEGAQVVFHLGALIGIPYSYVNPYDVVQTNVLGTYHVLAAARDLGVERVVHTSTSEVYGSARFVPMDESHPLQGQSPYSASKIGADKLAESFHLSFGLPVSTVRPFNTYGPRQSARAVIPTIISQALTQDFVKLGALYPRRDFTYATDTAAGFIAAAESDATIGEVVNLGTGDDISIGDLADLVIELIGREIEIRSDEGRVRPEGSEVVRLLSNNAKAKEVMGWQPTVSFAEGLRETIDWVDEHLNLYQIKRYTV